MARCPPILGQGCLLLSVCHVIYSLMCLRPQLARGSCDIKVTFAALLTENSTAGRLIRNLLSFYLFCFQPCPFPCKTRLSRFFIKTLIPFLQTTFSSSKHLPWSLPPNFSTLGARISNQRIWGKQSFRLQIQIQKLNYSVNCFLLAKNFH